MADLNSIHPDVFDALIQAERRGQSPSPYGNSALTDILGALQGPQYTSDTIPYGVSAQDKIAGIYDWMSHPPPAQPTGSMVMDFFDWLRRVPPHPGAR